jgi:hypothetical protein
MSFANPPALWAGLLAVPIVALYLRPFRLPQLPISAPQLWQEALAAEPSRLAWRPWRGPVSLVVQLMVLAFLVLALADPQWDGLRLWRWLAAAAIVLLAVQWPLYQRRWLI